MNATKVPQEIGDLALQSISAKKHKSQVRKITKAIAKIDLPDTKKELSFISEKTGKSISAESISVP